MAGRDRVPASSAARALGGVPCAAPSRCAALPSRPPPLAIHESRTMSLRLPNSTYRLQLNRQFGFREAAAIAGYLARLGVSDLYVSPIFKAAPGSTHGYDVLDHEELNPELGGAEGFDALCEAAKSHGLGLIVDFVPNHMGVGCDGNKLWEDVLEHGQAALHARFFDIDWNPPKQTLKGKVLLPILPDQYGVTLESGYFSLHFEGAAPRLRA